MTTLRIALSISPEQFVEWYRGAARSVVARAHTGQTVQFPASILQQFVERDGVRGEFLLTYDENHRFVKIERADPSDGFEAFG